MSKQKNLDNSPETENEVTENIVEQNELEGISSTPEEVKEESIESSPEIEKPVKAKLAKVTPVISTKGNSTGKMGVNKFLLLYPQDYFIEALLKTNYPKSFFTVEGWFARIDELLNTTINN